MFITIKTEQRATIIDIAKEANVSISTVSRVFNGSTAVSKKTKRKVEKAMEDLNYIPNAIARSLVCKTSNTIGIVASDLTNPFFTEVIDGIEDYFNSQGFTLILSNSRYKVEKENLYISQMVEKRVDGIIILNAYSENMPLISKIKNTVPIVAIQAVLAGVDCVNTRDEDGAYKAVDFLIKQGHTKIAFLKYNFENTTLTNRLKGYYKAHKDSGLAINKNYILTSEFSPYCGYHMANEILNNFPEVTAIFAFNDQIALSTYNAIQTRGLKIPDDMSIIGVDNIEYGSLTAPKLTTVEQPTYQMGKNAAELLLRRIKDENISEPQEIILPTKLIIKESTRKI